jgi:hypothetical protein
LTYVLRGLALPFPKHSASLAAPAELYRAVRVFSGVPLCLLFGAGRKTFAKYKRVRGNHALGSPAEFAGSRHVVFSMAKNASAP